MLTRPIDDKQCQELLNSLVESGGASYWFDGEDKTDGYAVAHNKVSATFPREILGTYNYGVYDLVRCLANMACDYNLDGLGFWYDKDSGVVYIDGIFHIQSRKLAIAVGYTYNQIAIYDLMKDEEIRLPG